MADSVFSPVLAIVWDTTYYRTERKFDVLTTIENLNMPQGWGEDKVSTLPKKHSHSPLIYCGTQSKTVFMSKFAQHPKALIKQHLPPELGILFHRLNVFVLELKFVEWAFLSVSKIATKALRQFKRPSCISRPDRSRFLTIQEQYNWQFRDYHWHFDKAMRHSSSMRLKMKWLYFLGAKSPKSPKSSNSPTVL